MTFKDIPYVGNPGSACALACCTMVSTYFFPETTFEKIARISRWKEGYVVWEMPFWNWIMEQGISVTNYDLIDFTAWAENGTRGLKTSVPKKEFTYYKEHTHDLESYTKDIQKMVVNPCFKQYQRNPTWSDLVTEFDRDAICTVVFNSAVLDGKEGFTLHQVVILDITDTEVIFHDSRGGGREMPKRHETHEHFCRAWLETTNAPSLTAYLRE